MVKKPWRLNKAKIAVDGLRHRLHQDGFEFNPLDAADPFGMAEGYLDCKICPATGLTHRVALECLSRDWGLDVSAEEPNDELLAGGLYVAGMGAQRWIFVEATDHRVRQRWSVAHEIGHLIAEVLPRLEKDRATIGELIAPVGQSQLLNYGRCELRSRGPLTQKDKLELDANDFAAELLIPLAGIRTLLSKEYSGGFRNQADIDLFVRALRKRYDVSQDAAQRRILKDLEIRANADGPSKDLFL
jgi:hypothetical protein